MKPPIPIAVTFDAAGTLFTIADPVGATYSRIARAHGINAEAEAIDRAFQAWFNRLPPPHSPGAASENETDSEGDAVERQWWRILVGRVFSKACNSEPPSEETTDALFEDLFEYYADAASWRLMPGVVDVLEPLRGRAKLGVISNFDRRFHSIARGLGLSRFFDEVILSCEIRAFKPDPAIFAAASRRLEVEPSRILHVGDDPVRDGEGARKAGFQFFPVTNETNPISEILGRFDFPQ